MDLDQRDQSRTVRDRLRDPDKNTAQERFERWMVAEDASTGMGEAVARSSCDHQAVEALISSRGQDALESLDDLVQRSVLRVDDAMLMACPTEHR